MGGGGRQRWPLYMEQGVGNFVGGMKMDSIQFGLYFATIRLDSSAIQT